MAEHTVLTLSQFAQHKSKKDCWLVIDGRVLNVTKFLEEHPGGEEVLLESAGKDCDMGIQRYWTQQDGSELGPQLPGWPSPGLHYQEGCRCAGCFDRGTQKERNDCFVIKDEPMPTYAAPFEFIVSLVVAGSYFCYRYLTAGSSMF